MKSSYQLWLGTESSFAANAEIESLISARIAGGFDVPSGDDEKPYDVVGGVAIVSIRGPLTNTSSFFNKLFGRMSYEEIRAAVSAAADDADVHTILLDIDSGGGAVAGVTDAATLIENINANVKPVVSFTGGSMASAAYWLGSSAGEVYADKIAVVGSIGVLARYMTHARALDNEGVDVHIARSGDFKALASGVEPMNDKVKSHLDSQVMTLDKIFVEHVAKSRSVSFDYAHANMAQGKEFIGAQSLDVRLIDGVTSFDDLLAKLVKPIDTSKKLMNNGLNSLQGDVMTRRAVSESTLAAMAEGVAAAHASAEQGEAHAESGESAGESESASSTTGAVADAKAESDAGLVSYLQGQVKEKDAALLAANVEIANLNKAAADALACHDGFRAIAMKSVSNMRVALRMPAVDASGFSDAQLLADHKSLSDEFTKQYPVGGVASADASVVETKSQSVDPVHIARVNAARFVK